MWGALQHPQMPTRGQTRAYLQWTVEARDPATRCPGVYETHGCVRRDALAHSLRLAAYAYSPGGRGDRISKCGSAFRGQASARRDHCQAVTDNHTNLVLRGQQTRQYTPPGVPQAWTPRAGKTKLRAGRGCSARGGNVFQVLGEGGTWLHSTVNPASTVRPALHPELQLSPCRA